MMHECSTGGLLLSATHNDVKGHFSLKYQAGHKGLRAALRKDPPLGEATCEQGNLRKETEALEFTSHAII